MKLSKNLLCPVCGETTLELIQDKETQIYKGQSEILDFHYAECSECGAETATSEQLRFNKRQMIKFQKRVDGLLSSHEIRIIREQLGLTVKQAGEIFGGGPVAFSKYENDDLVQSIPMDSALLLARSNPEAVYSIAKRRSVKVTKKVVTRRNKFKPEYESLKILKVENHLHRVEMHSELTTTFLASIDNSNHEVYQKCQTII